MRAISFSWIILTALFAVSGCKDIKPRNSESTGSDTGFPSMIDRDTQTQKNQDTTTATFVDSSVSTQLDSVTSIVSPESDTVIDSMSSTDERPLGTSIDIETDTQIETDRSSGSIESDKLATDSAAIDTDTHEDTDTKTDIETGMSTDSAQDTGTAIANSSDTESEKDGGADSGDVKDTETEHPQDCSVVGVNDFGDCEAALGWANAGHHCAPISGCSCEPHCDRFFETEDACLVTCFDLTACGGPLGNTCADDQYCDFKTGEDCGDGGATAICRTRMKGCEAIYWPVCGCDGITYENQCEAGAVGWGFRYEGTCNTP